MPGWRSDIDAYLAASFRTYGTCACLQGTRAVILDIRGGLCKRFSLRRTIFALCD